MPDPTVSGTFHATLTDTTSSLTVDQFVPSGPDRPTPGDVGICFSGGGSRALSSAMGQLRGLSQVERDGTPLPGLAKALTTVSGGSWFGVTWSFLSGGTSDEAFLGPYQEPSTLTPSGIASLPSGNVGNTVATRLFSVPALAVEAFVLWKFFDTPLDFLWQALMGLHILGPYGLFEPTGGVQPTSLFSWDKTSLRNDVTGPNPSLGGSVAHLVASGEGRTRRPFLVCNTALILEPDPSGFRFLAPVQATPFFTGVVGSPTGTDANGRRPGGGGVTSFAMPSNPTAVDGEAVTVTQPRQLALVDIVGCSSAAYAETLANLFADLAHEGERGLRQFLATVEELGEEIIDWLEKHLTDRADSRLAHARAFLAHTTTARPGGELTAESLRRDLEALTALIPAYSYWPAAEPGPYPQTKPTQFADGGSIEGLGLADLLAWSDVKRFLAFANSPEPLELATGALVAEDGSTVPVACGGDGQVPVVASQIPPLFGYQPYARGVGYAPYAGATDPKYPTGAHSRVLPAERFVEVLDGLWKASAGGTRPASFRQDGLPVQDNEWFGVRGGGRRVDVLWNQLTPVADWVAELPADVASILDGRGFEHFPNIPTLETGLTPQQVNLLASLTAWCVVEQGEVFSGMFEE